MSDRLSPIHKTPTEILADLVDGHNAARLYGVEKSKKYLLTLCERGNSIPNAVKFFLYDLLAADASRTNDLDTCRAAVSKASFYLPAAQAEMLQSFREYSSSIHFFELGISLAIDDGEFDKALTLCDEAIAHGLNKVYAAKRASIERMM